MSLVRRYIEMSLKYINDIPSWQFTYSLEHKTNGSGHKYKLINWTDEW